MASTTSYIDTRFLSETEATPTEGESSRGISMALLVLIKTLCIWIVEKLLLLTVREKGR
jgi:hypothetical protein